MSPWSWLAVREPCAAALPCWSSTDNGASCVVYGNLITIKYSTIKTTYYCWCMHLCIQGYLLQWGPTFLARKPQIKSPCLPVLHSGSFPCPAALFSGPFLTCHSAFCSLPYLPPWCPICCAPHTEAAPVPWDMHAIGWPAPIYYIGVLVTAEGCPVATRVPTVLGAVQIHGGTYCPMYNLHWQGRVEVILILWRNRETEVTVKVS